MPNTYSNTIGVTSSRQRVQIIKPGAAKIQMLTLCTIRDRHVIRKSNFSLQLNAICRFQFPNFSSQSTPESWAQNSHDNIVAAENERMASVQMRELINNILHDTAKDMREQADRVENAFGKRIEEVAAAKAKMENQLENVIWLFLFFFCANRLVINGLVFSEKTLDEIARQEKNIQNLKNAIRNKEAPMKVAQTRLHDRSVRPEIELCRDPAHTQ
jgi:hypothetical protein